MKSKTYKNGKTTFRSYLKTAGGGYEVGFTCGTKTVFLGNFVHAAEANQWYGQMNADIRKFAQRFTVARNCPLTWYTHFMASHLYKNYYAFVNRALGTHARKAVKAVNRETRRYQEMNRNWYATDKTPFLKAA